jgi:hypothetical protein
MVMVDVIADYGDLCGERSVWDEMTSVLYRALSCYGDTRAKLRALVSGSAYLRKRSAEQLQETAGRQ